MRICILMPSEEYTRQAGVRIRYQRIAPRLSQEGHTLSLLNISEAIAAPGCDDDIYIISKCYDARAFLALDRFSRAGKLIGIDLFDDYFSQEGDSRMLRLRRWLRTMLNHVHFVLCSTSVIRDFIEERAPGLPVHVLNDPVESSDKGSIMEALERKPKGAGLNVAWFGMGDNSHFPVGLDDLTAFAGELSRLEDSNRPMRLTILTNQRALTAERLGRLGKLPFDHTIDEWSEVAEKHLLAQSHVVFLPVNAQDFSVAKSLNRALTALFNGCQVLSVGYPLYAPLAEFIYRSAGELKEDEQTDAFRLRSETVSAFVEHANAFADSAFEASTVASFLDDTLSRNHKAPKSDAAFPAAIIFGRDNHLELYNLTKRSGALSVKGPYSNSTRNFDMRIEWSREGNKLQILVEDKALEKVVGEKRKLFEAPLAHASGVYAKLTDTAQLPSEISHGLSMYGRDNKLVVASCYDDVVRSVIHITKYLFPAREIFTSEEMRIVSMQ